MTEYDWGEACELREKLEEYYLLEGDEHGNAVEHLCALAQYPDYITQDLWNAVVKGMKDELANYEEYCTIVTTPETYTHESKELVWE